MTFLLASRSTCWCNFFWKKLHRLATGACRSWLVSIFSYTKNKKVDHIHIFCYKLYVLMSNSDLECSQLSFDMHIVHIDWKMTTLGFSCSKFSWSKYATSAHPYGQTVQHRTQFKDSTDRGRCQEQYLSVWWPLQWPQRPPEAIFYQRAESAPPPWY